jgi:protein-L-isoaspartate(D-aspartate) O-methyltransferase
MNIEQARFNMIEQQIRTWDVLDPTILNVLERIKREQFVLPAYQNLAFADVEIPLAELGHPEYQDEHMLFPKLDARMLQILELQGTERVLEIGTGSGYFTALLSQLSKQVISIECHDDLAQKARERLAGYSNVEVIWGDGSKGLLERAPFDVIVISGSVPVVPAILFEQLALKGKLLAIVGEAPAMTLSLFKNAAPSQYERFDLLETVVLPYIKHVERPKASLI